MRVGTFACTAAVTSSVVAAAAATSQATFTALTHNVAGLPAFLNGNGATDKKENTREIGRRFAKYNYSIINVQEDFNYHAYLYETDTHPFRTPTSGGVPFGSGLNTLTNFNYTDLVREKWSKCDLDEGDCLTPKGYSRVTVMLPERDNATLDIYNLHADAGSESGDSSARRSNFAQVAQAVSSRVDVAALIMGDTNARYTRTADELQSTLVDAANLTDTWVEMVRKGDAPAAGADALLCDEPVPANNSCEVVDKVFYKSSSFLTLTPTAWQYVGDKFLDANGSALSDHVPIQVTFSY